MHKKLAAILALAGMAITGAGTVGTDTHEDARAHDLAVVPACQYDDGTSSDGGDVCYWDAGEAGNDAGRNFLAMHIGRAMVFTYEDGTVTRVPLSH